MTEKKKKPQNKKDSTTDLDVEESISEHQNNPPDSQEIQDENQAMAHRQEQFRIAAGNVADSLSNIPEVQKVVLLGSVAKPLEKEIPRFRKFRRAGITIRRECQDADMAVWISDLRCLKAIQKARSQALNRLFAERGIGVAHHQIDILVIEPDTNRYLGRLCVFGSCPKGKRYNRRLLLPISFRTVAWVDPSCIPVERTTCAVPR